MEENFYKLKPHSILFDINCSIGNESKHLTEEQVVKLFNKKVDEFDVLDKYAVDVLQTEVSKESLEVFVKEYKISKQKLDYILKAKIYY